MSFQILLNKYNDINLINKQNDVKCFIKCFWGDLSFEKL